MRVGKANEGQIWAQSDWVDWKPEGTGKQGVTILWGKQQRSQEVRREVWEMDDSASDELIQKTQQTSDISPEPEDKLKLWPM